MVVCRLSSALYLIMYASVCYANTGLLLVLASLPRKPKAGLGGHEGQCHAAQAPPAVTLPPQSPQSALLPMKSCIHTSTAEPDMPCTHANTVPDTG